MNPHEDGEFYGHRPVNWSACSHMFKSGLERSGMPGPFGRCSCRIIFQKVVE